MKRSLFSILLAGTLALCSCGEKASSDIAPAESTTTTTAASAATSQPENTSLPAVSAYEVDYDHPEIAKAMLEVVQFTPEEAIEKADIIMIGEYLDDNSETYTFSTKHQTVDAELEMTYNTLKAVKVFKGGELIGDGKVDVFENYAFVLDTDGKTRLILNSELVPMYKGDKAIFLLEYNDTVKKYTPLESQGRFPLPEDKDKTDKLGFKNGIRDDVDFKQAIYDALLEKYDIK